MSYTSYNDKLFVNTFLFSLHRNEINVNSHNIKQTTVLEFSSKTDV